MCWCSIRCTAHPQLAAHHHRHAGPDAGAAGRAGQDTGGLTHAGSELERNTNETQIELTLNLDGAGRYQVDTGCGFLNHMLELFARHGRST